MSTIGLGKLVKRAVLKGIPPKEFISLYKQLNDARSISPNEYLSELLDIDSNNTTVAINRQALFCIELSLSSIEQLSLFWLNLIKLDDAKQILFLIQLSKYLKHNHKSVTNSILIELINKELFSYSISKLEAENKSFSTEEINSFVDHVVFLWGLLFDILPDLFQTDTVKKILVLSNSLPRNEQTNYMTMKSKKLLKTSDMKIEILSSSENSNTKSTYSQKNIFSLNNDGNSKVQEFKKLFWVSFAIKSWRFEDNDKFLDSFKKTINRFENLLNELSPELIRLLLKASAYAKVSHEPDYVLFNYKNFITSRLPILLSKLNQNDSKRIENAIHLAFKGTSESTLQIISDFKIAGFPCTDLRKAFIKSCIANELIPIHARLNFFAQDESMSQQALIHELNQHKLNIDIKHELNEKLLDVNTEFTSLSESGLAELMVSLPNILEFLYTDQSSSSAIISEVIDNLIAERDNEKLTRLLLSLSSNTEVLKLYVFNCRGGPFLLLNKLINYIDFGEFGIDDEDSSQDLFSHFGITLLSIISLVEVFKIDFSKFSIKTSYVSDYLNSFYYRLCDNLTLSEPSNLSNDESTIIANYNSLLSDWIDALFDDNNDGLSDDLIKSVNVKQIFKMIPIIYQRSIIATKSGKIDFKILSNGLDYLSQVFLVSCTLSIIRWLVSSISFSENSSSLTCKILCELIMSNTPNEDDNELNSESYLAFKIVLNLTGMDILSTLRKAPQGSSGPVSVTIDRVNRVLGDGPSSGPLKKVKLNSSLNLAEQFKNELITIVHKNQLDYLLIIRFLELNDYELTDLIIDQTVNSQKSNNDDHKIFIQLSIYLILLNTIRSNNDISSCKMKFASSSHQYLSILDGAITSDKEFTLTLDFHYSSIFNDQGTQDEENDDLFNENSSKFYRQDEIRSHSALSFSSLFDLIARTEVCESERANINRALKSIRQLLVEELEKLAI
ncbi:uncharacterized protein PRCAT00000418001 [Priceomyces carsonii]|uniref:uncharacterized protein n=1 Tax=Priceomyces carsonii TaxID=28549 RepID=UPI002ED97086|nr:unnamed protein product [Priceomyces carsonii]